jgi:Mrp family chromosome partitioning ATPase
LSAQLLEHWFGEERVLLPVVGSAGASRVARELARRFAEMGERTLLIDGDLRAPELHAVFGLPNENGLADALDGGTMQVARGGDGLAVLVSGRVRQEPLELLSRPRLPDLLREAANAFRIVIIATAAPERGPDFEIFAALAGGALVVAPYGVEAPVLGGLRTQLERCAARLVATVVERR